MAQKKESITNVTAKIYELLDPLDSGDRHRAIAAALTLLGESPLQGVPQPPASGGTAGQHGIPQVNTGGDAKAFFDAKDPRTKMEELAVAAAFREQQDLHEHAKADFEQVIRSARRDFANKHFARDLNNAKTKGFFNKGSGHQLSHYGQKYVEALPDREAAKAIPKPKGSRGARSTRKKRARKKS